MTPLLVTIIATLLFAVLETVFHYVRDHRMMAWSTRPVLIGAVFWALALIIFQRYRTTIDMPSAVLNGVVGGVVWYLVAFMLGRMLWRSADKRARRR